MKINNKLVLISFSVILILSFIWYVVLKQNFANVYVLVNLAKINLSFPDNTTPTIYYVTGKYNIGNEITSNKTTLTYNRVGGYLIQGGWYINNKLATNFDFSPSTNKGDYPKISITIESSIYTYIPADTYNTTAWNLTPVKYIIDANDNTQIGKITSINSLTQGPSITVGSKTYDNTFIIDIDNLSDYNITTSNTIIDNVSLPTVYGINTEIMKGSIKDSESIPNNSTYNVDLKTWSTLFNNTIKPSGDNDIYLSPLDITYNKTSKEVPFKNGSITTRIPPKSVIYTKTGEPSVGTETDRYYGSINGSTIYNIFGYPQ